MMETLLLLVILGLSLPVAVLAFQLGSALLAHAGHAPPAHSSDLPRPSVALLVPAHNEEAGLATTLASLQTELGEGDRLLVVADNCEDRTASVARSMGAEVGERFDQQRRGKGYALDFGVRLLSANPPQVVIIVDADCTVEPGAIGRLARQAMLSERPVQARYLMHGTAASGLHIAQFAWLVKNYVRPLGMHHASLPCQLTGSGMAFPWGIISQVDIANGNLVEDMQLGLDLAASGNAPQFCPNAIVSSIFPTHDAALAAQRTRWEHGHLAIMTGILPRLLWRALRRHDMALAAMLIDLAVPPLSLLVLFSGTAFLLSVLAALLGGAWMPLWASSAQLGAIGCFLVIAWLRFSRQRLAPGDVLIFLNYLLSKISIYRRFLTSRQKAWIRTERD